MAVSLQHELKSANHVGTVKAAISAFLYLSFAAIMMSGLQAMPHDAFVNLYERPRTPVVITGLQESWKAQELWNQTELDKRFANHKFKVHLLAQLHSQVSSTAQPSQQHCTAKSAALPSQVSSTAQPSQQHCPAKSAVLHSQVSSTAQHTYPWTEGGNLKKPDLEVWSSMPFKCIVYQAALIMQPDNMELSSMSGKWLITHVLLLTRHV